MALRDVENFESVTGKGVQGAIDGRRVALGNSAMMCHIDLGVSDLKTDADSLAGEGATVMYLAVDGKPAG